MKRFELRIQLTPDSLNSDISRYPLTYKIIVWAHSYFYDLYGALLYLKVKIHPKIGDVPKR